jgi:DNA-binding MarR family transcriptional regulator
MSDGAHRELSSRIRDVLKAVRVFKSQSAPHPAAIPAGTFGVLATIATGDAAHVRDLAAECALDPSTVSRAVAALVRAGLVAREADPTDGRACVLAVTDHGLSVLDDVLTHYDRRLAAALRDWTTEDLQVFATLLRRFTDDVLAEHQTPKPSLQEAAR